MYNISTSITLIYHWLSDYLKLRWLMSKNLIRLIKKVSKSTIRSLTALDIFRSFETEQTTSRNVWFWFICCNDLLRSLNDLTQFTTKHLHLQPWCISNERLLIDGWLLIWLEISVVFNKTFSELFLRNYIYNCLHLRLNVMNNRLNLL
jgi:hypothetical protein